MHGEDSWRAAARIRIALTFGENNRGSLPAAGAASKRIAGYPPRMWNDADVRWLMDVHEALVPPELALATRQGMNVNPAAAPAEQKDGESDGEEGRLRVEFFNKELHEDLLWWLQLPRLAQLLLLQMDRTSRSSSERPAAAMRAVRAGHPKAGNTERMVKENVQKIEAEVRLGLNQAQESGYRTAALLAAPKPSRPTSPTPEPQAPAVEPEPKTPALSRVDGTGKAGPTGRKAHSISKVKKTEPQPPKA